MATWYPPEAYEPQVVIDRQPGGCLGALLQPSTWALIAVNVINGHFAISQQWTGSTVLWSFWAQCVVIGAFTALRLVRVPFSLFDLRQSQNSEGDSELVRGKPRRQWRNARNFCLGYGSCVFFFLPLSAFIPAGVTDWRAVALASGFYAAGHLVSYLQTRSEDLRGDKPLFLVFGPPLIRALMLVVILAIFWQVFLTGDALPFVIVVKGIVDVFGHMLRHGYIGPPRPKPPLDPAPKNA